MNKVKVINIRMQNYTPKKFINILIKHGFEFSHRKSNHVSYVKDGMEKIITIPVDRKEICKPLAKRLLKDAGIL